MAPAAERLSVLSSRTHHFIGIGGVGMSALAQVLHERGGRVSGSDQQASANTKHLEDLGVPIHIGHAAENIATADVVVVSTAVHADNPELKAALERGIAIRHRSELLSDIMAAHRSIAVTGTHGKTTTTGMVASILLAGQLDPTVLIGGHLPAIDGTARTGHSEWLVAEADESDKSIRRLTAEIVILTNLEGDHLEHYGNLEEIYEVMVGFISSLPPDAQVVACLDDPGVQAILPRITHRVHTYGWSPQAEHRLSAEVLDETGTTFCLNDTSYQIRVPGRHNVSNSAAAIIAAGLVGMQPAGIQAGIEQFTGVGRRFQFKGTVAGVTVIDDYAHHPSEIRATLATAKLLNRPIWAVFQPHRYTRTAALFEDFGQAFSDSDAVCLMDIYSAGEPANGVTSGMLVERIQRQHAPEAVYFWPSQAEVVDGLLARLTGNEIVLLMGAGNIFRVAEPLLEGLRVREKGHQPA